MAELSRLARTIPTGPGPPITTGSRRIGCRMECRLRGLIRVVGREFIMWIDCEKMLNGNVHKRNPRRVVRH